MKYKIAFLVPIAAILLLPCTLLAQNDRCNVENSVIPPNWCKFPDNVPNPTSPKYIKGGGEGTYKLQIDDAIFTVFTPSTEDDENWPFYVSELSTRSREAKDWLRVRGRYEVDVFTTGLMFYKLGIPLLGIRGGGSIRAIVHVMSPPENRTVHPEVYKDSGDFSKPAELQAYLERNRGVPEHSTPVEEVIINGRKWYRYWWNSPGYPDDLREVYVTGLAPDRFLEVYVRQYPVPFVESRYPTYPTEDRMPGWMKETHKFKEQVIQSLRISHEADAVARDLYEVEVAAENEEVQSIPK
jgi:hypothetical protein